MAIRISVGIPSSGNRRRTDTSSPCSVPLLFHRSPRAAGSRMPAISDAYPVFDGGAIERRFPNRRRRSPLRPVGWIAAPSTPIAPGSTPRRCPSHRCEPYKTLPSVRTHTSRERPIAAGPLECRASPRFPHTLSRARTGCITSGAASPMHRHQSPASPA